MSNRGAMRLIDTIIKHPTHCRITQKVLKYILFKGPQHDLTGVRWIEWVMSKYDISVPIKGWYQGIKVSLSIFSESGYAANKIISCLRCQIPDKFPLQQPLASQSFKQLFKFLPTKLQRSIFTFLLVCKKLKRKKKNRHLKDVQYMIVDRVLNLHFY